jgi:hypothetical protein
MKVPRWLRDAFLDDGPPPEPAPGEIVVLTGADDEATAGLYRNLLEQHGIPCVLQNTSASAYLRFGQSWEVRVRYKDVARATEILDLGEEPPA